MSYSETLERVRSLIARKPRTALEIADLTGCSKPTAYARLAGLRAKGIKLSKQRVRQGSSGPAAIAYGLSNDGA